MNESSRNTIIHRLHPAVKLLWLVTACVVLCLSQSPVLPMIAAFGALALLWLVGYSPLREPAIRYIAIVTVFILAMQVYFGGHSDQDRETVTNEGLILGMLTAGRLAAVMLLSILFVKTTEPVALAYALMRVGLPYRWGFTLVTALRLAPLFRTEGNHVYRAQLLRGIAYDSRGPRRIWLVLRHLCHPMLIIAMRSAQNLAVSMEGRGFGLYPTRTNMRKLTIGKGDVVALGVLLLLIVAAVVC